MFSKSYNYTYKLNRNCVTEMSTILSSSPEVTQILCFHQITLSSVEIWSIFLCDRRLEFICLCCLLHVWPLCTCEMLKLDPVGLEETVWFNCGTNDVPDKGISYFPHLLQCP